MWFAKSKIIYVAAKFPLPHHYSWADNCKNWTWLIVWGWPHDRCETVTVSIENKVWRGPKTHTPGPWMKSIYLSQIKLRSDFLNMDFYKYKACNSQALLLQVWRFEMAWIKKWTWPLSRKMWNMSLVNNHIFSLYLAEA